MYYNAFAHLKTKTTPAKPVVKTPQRVTKSQYEQFIKLRASALAGKA
jgi:hypothetical protein